MGDSASVFVYRRKCAQGFNAQWLHVKKKTKYYKERNEEVRRAHKETIASIQEETIIYIDETGIEESLHRDKCRAKRGEKVYSGVSGRKYHRTNIVAGLCCGRLIAPMEYAGTTDHIIFETWFERVLLAKSPVGSTFVMDNASFHRKGTLNELAQRGHCRVVFLPAYSPDYNPIENTWANLKTFLRNYACRFHSLQDAITDYFKTE